MANTNNPNGFEVVQNGSGGVNRSNEYAIQSGYNTSISNGDLVTLTAGYVTRAEAGDRILGVFKGLLQIEGDGQFDYRKNWVANTVNLGGDDVVCVVEDDPNAILEAQFVGGSTPVRANIGTRYNANETAGSTNTGRSLEGVVNTTEAAGTLICVGFSRLPENTIDDNARARFRIARHVFNTQP